MTYISEALIYTVEGVVASGLLKGKLGRRKFSIRVPAVMGLTKD